MKVKIVICVIAALLVFSGASPWEGAAAVAPEGELPATGRYVATNSFPVNTIVDITNIENNRSTRAIVANNLNSPGLLAVVSIEAAELIGMRPGSVSRIRMVQPSDPIAYLRFTEGANANIPEYDSGNVITEEQLLNEFYGTDTYIPPSNGNNGSSTAPSDGTRGPSYTLEPEWSGRRIIDLPGYVEYPPIETAQPPVTPATPVTPVTPVTPPVNETPQTVAQIPEQRVPVEPVNETPSVSEQSRSEVIKDIPEYITEVPRNEAEKDIPAYVTEVSRDETEKEIHEYFAEVPRDEAEKEIPEYFAEVPRDETEKEIPEYFAEVPRDETEKDIPEYFAELSREEADKDVPAYIAEVPANEAEKDVAEKIEEEPRDEIAKDIEPGQYALVPTEERPPENNTIYGIDPSLIIPGVTAAPPSQETTRETTRPAVPVTPPVTDTAFSIPRIFGLDYGKYYVQVAAVDTPEQVESTVRRIDRSYQPVVYKDGDNWYRILLGPLNQGESAAILQRFKSIGFNDAFVRRGS